MLIFSVGSVGQSASAMAPRRSAAAGSNFSDTILLLWKLPLCVTLPGLRLSQCIVLTLVELPHCVQTQRVSYCEMAIKGEVHVRNHPAATFEQGRYVIQPFECKITGTGQGSARIKASIHTRLASFDEEEWRIITLTVGHLDSQFKYTDLFAPSCGSIGDFTDIKKFDEGYLDVHGSYKYLSNLQVDRQLATALSKDRPSTKSEVSRLGYVQHSLGLGPLASYLAKFAKLLAPTRKT